MFSSLGISNKREELLNTYSIILLLLLLGYCFDLMHRADRKTAGGLNSNTTSFLL